MGIRQFTKHTAGSLHIFYLPWMSLLCTSRQPPRTITACQTLFLHNKNLPRGERLLQLCTETAPAFDVTHTHIQCVNETARPPVPHSTVHDHRA